MFIINALGQAIQALFRRQNLNGGYWCIFNNYFVIEPVDFSFGHDAEIGTGFTGRKIEVQFG